MNNKGIKRLNGKNNKQYRIAAEKAPENTLAALPDVINNGKKV